MSTYMRKLMAFVATGALLLGLIAYLPGDSAAANLTNGTYTYVINGEEVTFTVDPINRKDGLLLPAEVFLKFDIALEGATTKIVTLKRSDVTVTVTLGTPVFQVNGKNDLMPTTALRLNGRTFLPADLLKQFGAEYSLDGTYVVMRDTASSVPPVKATGDAEYAGLKGVQTISASVKSDNSIYLTGEFTVLTPALLQASKFDVSYGTRVRLQNLSETNTLVLVKLSNSAFKSGALVTAGLYLVDAARRQYEVASVFDIGEGMVNVKLAPGGDRTGVLVFPKATAVGPLTLYYDNNGAAVGTVTNP